MNLYIELIQFITTVAAGVFVVLLYVALKRKTAEADQLQRKLEVSFQNAQEVQREYLEAMGVLRDERDWLRTTGALEVHSYSVNNPATVTQEECIEVAGDYFQHALLVKAAGALSALTTDQFLALVLRHVETRLGALACKEDTVSFGRLEESKKYTRMAGRLMRQVMNFRKENRL